MTLDLTAPLTATLQTWAERRRLAEERRARHHAEQDVRRAVRSFISGD